MSEHYEFEGKTVEDAVAQGLSDLGLSRSQVTINVIRKGSRGLFGIGSESALVQIVPQMTTTNSATNPTTAHSVGEEADSAEPEIMVSSTANSEHASEATSISSTAEDSFTEEEADDDVEDDDWQERYAHLDDIDREVTKMAVFYLEEITDLMGFGGDVTATWQDPEPDEVDPCLLLEIHGEDLQGLVGARGETIDSMQYLLRLMINQKVRAWRNIVIDVDGYKAKRSQQLNQLALRMAEQVVESERAMSLEPMPANERRLVHLALRDHPGVYTESSGDTDRRKVHIIPKSML